MWAVSAGRVGAGVTCAVSRGTGQAGWPEARFRRPRAPGHVEQAQGALLLEVQGLAGRGWDPADAPPQLGYLGPDPRITEHPQAERQFRRADVQPPLDVQAQGHRGQVVPAELA